ncbi:MAG: DUF2007 domain-containing protein [Bacteroidales bacterium]
MITLISCSNINDAYMIRSLLESEEIGCFILNEHMSTIYGGILPFQAEVKILEEDYEAALKLLQDHGYLE